MSTSDWHYLTKVITNWNREKRRDFIDPYFGNNKHPKILPAYLIFSTMYSLPKFVYINDHLGVFPDIFFCILWTRHRPSFNTKYGALQTILCSIGPVQMTCTFISGIKMCNDRVALTPCIKTYLVFDLGSGKLRMYESLDINNWS